MGSRTRRPASASTGSSSSSSTASPLSSLKAHQALLNNPYEYRDSRRFLRNLPYPLPVDLAEQNRQIIHTKLLCEVFGTPICAPSARLRPPRRVLEVACGTSFWSELCAEYLQIRHGNTVEVQMVGMDIAPQSPRHTSTNSSISHHTTDSKASINWTFIQHDLRRFPWPFNDSHFDLVMLKDINLVLPGSKALQRLLEESTRILRAGGVLEFWATDHQIRALQPNPPLPPHVTEDEARAARGSATYLFTPGTPFAPAQHAALAQANGWIADALETRGFSAAPCARIESALHQEVENLRDVGSRRVAVPFAEMRWERRELLEGLGMISEQDLGKQQKLHDSVLSARGKDGALLTPDQAALRRAALLSHLMMIESLEVLLQEASGMRGEEWASWWSGMMGDLLDPSASTPGRGALTGECLEIGAWWAVKRGKND